MIEFSCGWITGMMLGIEFPPVEDAVNEHDDDLKFAMVVDLFIVRFMFAYWKEAD